MINAHFKKDIVINAIVLMSWALATIITFVVTADVPILLAIASDLFMVVILIIICLNFNKNIKLLKKASQLIESANPVKLKVMIHPRGRTSFYVEPIDEKHENFLQGELINIQSGILNSSINNAFVDIFCDSSKVVVIISGDSYLWGLRER